jgi:hypothetical protein
MNAGPEVILDAAFFERSSFYFDKALRDLNTFVETAERMYSPRRRDARYPYPTQG